MSRCGRFLVLMAATWTSVACAVHPATLPSTANAAAVGVECRKRYDAIKISSEADKTILSITSPSGIGGATVERKADQWPEELILRIHLRGLESLSIKSGDATLRASVLSHSGNPRLLHLWSGNKEGPQLMKGDAYWMDIQTLDAQGRPIDGLPEIGGWFEMAIPKALLVDQNKT